MAKQLLLGSANVPVALALSCDKNGNLSLETFLSLSNAWG